MTKPDFEIDAANLPEGFAESIESVPDQPAAARPAATVVLARNGVTSIETLLVRRTRKSSFVPGAWVFPGGRVDSSDAHPELVALVDGLSPAQANARLELGEASDPPAIAYVLAAIREAFEETGLLVARTSEGGWPPDATQEPAVDQQRAAVLEDRTPFATALEQLKCRVDGAAIEYLAHWITPLVEPKRYDTRFFLAEVAPDSEATLDAREMTAAKWRTPMAALEENANGALPMVFPTIKTLQQLEGFETVAEAIEHFGSRRIPPILPRLVKTPTGVGIEIPDVDAG
jgi:8-oxo-dGTP pyrophosphatase MutT (NUDIX family)